MHDVNETNRGRGRGPWRHPHHPHHRRNEFGFGPDFGPPFGRGPRGGGRRRMRRGDVRAAIIVLLAEEPRNGYQLMQEIEQRSDGAWRPSPGSVYPALSQLEDEGLVAQTESDSGKSFELTEAGKSYFAEHQEKLGEPWSGLDEKVGTGAKALKNEFKPFWIAVGQLMQAGSESAAERGAEVLAEARRKIYAILAEDAAEDQ